MLEKLILLSFLSVRFTFSWNSHILVDILKKVYGIQKPFDELVHWVCYKKILDGGKYATRSLTCQGEKLAGTRSIYFCCHGAILLLIPRAEINACSLGLPRSTPTLCCLLTFFCLKYIKPLCWAYPRSSTDEVIILVFPKCFIFVSDIKYCVLCSFWLALHT